MAQSSRLVRLVIDLLVLRDRADRVGVRDSSRRPGVIPDMSPSESR